MKLRLIIFSWKYCSVNEKTLDLPAFECAIDIMADSTRFTRVHSNSIFNLVRRISRDYESKTVDFISYVIVADIIRLYSKINKKEENYITKGEFNLALDDSRLPMRYNQEIIDQIFNLIDDTAHMPGIDVESFVYYDFALQLFYLEDKTRPYRLSVKEIIKIVNSPLFPTAILNEITLMPHYNMTDKSYSMYQHYNLNEGDYFYKFSQVEQKEDDDKDSKSNKKAPKKNLKKYLNANINKIFISLDSDNDDLIQFSDFALFLQVSFTYVKFDKYMRGRLTAKELFEVYNNYEDFPALSSDYRKRANRFKYLDKAQKFDLLSAIQIMKIDDTIQLYVRSQYDLRIDEIALKQIVKKLSMQEIPDTYFTKCMVGTSVRNIPQYDADCCIMEGITLNVKYYSTMDNYQNVKQNDLKDLNIKFFNIDKSNK